MIRRLLLVFLLGITPALTSLTVHAAEQVMGQSERVNINRADADRLAQLLNGVGQSRAREIVRYREAYGPFHSLEDLLEVRGLGPSIINKNRDRITLE